MLQSFNAALIADTLLKAIIIKLTILMVFYLLKKGIPYSLGIHLQRHLHQLLKGPCLAEKHTLLFS